MRAAPDLVKKAIGLFFEGLILAFVITFCCFGYSSQKTCPDKFLSVRTNSIGELVMNEGVLRGGVEQLSINSIDLKWTIHAYEIHFVRPAKSSINSLFVNHFIRNVFYVFITANAP